MYSCSLCSCVDNAPDQPQAPQSFMGVKELFHKLVSSGVIPTTNTPADNDNDRSSTPPPKLETTEEKIPDVKFVIEDLKM